MGTPTGLTPEQKERIAKIAEDFKKRMERLEVGVTIKCGDTEVEVTPPPKECK